MNKWKIAFWCCLSLLIIVILFSLYAIIDQAYTITYHDVSYKDMKADFEQITEIINKTDLSKKQIKTVLQDHNNFELMNFNSDTIALNQVLLIFEKNKLKFLQKEW